MKSCPRVLIIIGSISDKDVIEPAISTLKSFKVPFQVRVSSAHRTPERTTDLARNAEDRGFRVIIAAAGWSAGLPGALAAETILPVIGVPVPSSVLLGMDAMLSMVQLPPGVPVATVAVGKGGAKNAALLAIQILANEFPELKESLKEFKQNMAKSVIAAAEELDASWNE
jgi:phosphoribosylaminoimidazole carboxylase PurE protein